MKRFPEVFHIFQMHFFLIFIVEKVHHPLGGTDESTSLIHPEIILWWSLSVPLPNWKVTKLTIALGNPHCRILGVLFLLNVGQIYVPHASKSPKRCVK